LWHFGGAERCIERFGGEIKKQLGRPRRKCEDKMDIGRLWTVLVLTQNRDRWRAVVNTLMNTSGIHKMRRISSIIEEVLASQT
jgi:hypothetical protein